LTSADKIAANRANARASTGPKTLAGKARSAKNARRHGLTLPALSDPTLSKEVEALALQIAGPGAPTEIQDLARRIAEAQVDLCRVRRARHTVLSRALSDPEYDSPRAIRQESKLAAEIAKLEPRLRAIEGATMLTRLVAGLKEQVQTIPMGPQKFATILSDMTQQLAAMDRYERRALSRRTFAIRVFDEARSRYSTI
jgi:hypothetical protein